MSIRTLKHLAVTVLFLGGAAFGQQPEDAGCPVAIERVNNCTDIGLNRGCGFQIEYRNVSAKKLKGVSFDATLFDAVNTTHPALSPFTDGKSLEPGKTTAPKWAAYWLTRAMRSGEGKNGAEAWVTKVLFEDGTVWADDGTHSCKGESNQRIKNK